MNTAHPSRPVPAIVARDSHHAALASHASCALLRAACVIPAFAFVFFSLPASPQSPASASVLPASQNSTAAPQTLDRVVAVVNNHAILLSDIDEEIRLSILDPADQTSGVLTPQRATEQLISRALIEQQMRQEDIKAADPTQAEIDARLKEIRTELPACVHANCASDDGWKAFLAAHGLTQDRVDATLRYRLQILSFIELRFRQGISVSDQEIAAYYHDKLLPQYTKGEEIPPLEKVAPRIQEILLQQKVNILFDDWLRNLRTQGDVEVLDPSLEKTGPAETSPVPPQTQGTQTGEGGER